MARVVEEHIVDDLEKTRDPASQVAASETVSFAYRGVPYSIDLSAANAMRFDETMDRYIGAARRIPRHQRSRASRERAADIRVWARDQGIKVSERGRIAGHIIREYDATHARPA